MKNLKEINSQIILARIYRKIPCDIRDEHNVLYVFERFKQINPTKKEVKGVILQLVQELDVALSLKLDYSKDRPESK